MAITRAQQARQMLKDGKVAIQGGGRNYLGKQKTVSNVPIKWQSGPNTPPTELAYITEAEKKLLLKEDIHGSLKDGPNKGPKGIISLNGDLADMEAGITGADISAAERGEGPRGAMTQDRADELRGGAIAAGAGPRDTDTAAAKREARQIRKNVADRRNIQRLENRFKFPSTLQLAKGPINKLMSKQLTQNRIDFLKSQYPELFDEEEGFINLPGNLQDLYEEGKLYTDEALDTMKALSGDDMNFAEYMAAVKGSPGLLYSGNVGNLVKTRNPETGLFEYTERLSEGEGENIRRRLLEESQQASAPEEIIPKINPMFYRLAANGGMIDDAPMMQGGITDLALRDEFFLGGVVKGIKKGLKGVTRAVKKIAKSPIGKAALLAAGGSYALGLGPFASGSTMFGGKLAGLKGAGFLKSQGLKDFFFEGGVPGFKNLTDRGIITALTATPFIGELLGLNEPKEEPIYAGPNLNFNAERYYRLAADGGRMGYQEGSKEPVAKKTMPLLDMGGKEKDYRETGGFVDMGRMERADDVPARLSKNEFVFTAEAVRNAGDGDVDKGSEVMYNMMKNLESGGDVSEESQGLDGARKMFQTSQRIGEVI